MDCSLPGSSIHGIFQARTLEWVAISFSRRSFPPRDWTWVSHIVGRRFTIWATKEVLPRLHIKKQRCNFANKGPSSQSYGFSRSHVGMWELDLKESWAPNNWCFWTVVLEKTIEGLWTARRSNQSILKEISPEYSLERLMLKLKLQYFGHLMRWADSLKQPLCWEGLKVGGEGDDRGWESWMASLTRWTWGWVNSGSWWWIGKPGMLESMGFQRVRHDWATELTWELKPILAHRS